MVEIIMEVGSIHDGSVGNAKKAIEFASRIDVDTIKFQIHMADFETTKYAQSPSYFRDETRYEYFTRTSFSLANWQMLVEYAKENALKFLISPFTHQAVPLMESIGVTNFKVASGEVSNFALLNALNKPNFEVILSTGMSDYGEIKEAVDALENCKTLTILQCTSKYAPLSRFSAVSIFFK